MLFDSSDWNVTLNSSMIWSPTSLLSLTYLLYLYPRIILSHNWLCMMPVTLIDLMSVFRFPLDVWVELPAYHDYGFAVFRLKDGEVPLKVHPVEFEFPQRHLGQLCFPTVYIRELSLTVCCCRSRNGWPWWLATVLAVVMVERQYSSWKLRIIDGIFRVGVKTSGEYGRIKDTSISADICIPSVVSGSGFGRSTFCCLQLINKMFHLFWSEEALGFKHSLNLQNSYLTLKSGHVLNQFLDRF